MLNNVTNKVMNVPVVTPSSKKQAISDFNSVLVAQVAASSKSQENITPILESKFDSTALRTPVDFTNMTPNEFNELYKSGHFSELPPIVLPKGLDLTKDTKAQIDASLDTKVNYIEMVKKEIEFNKSIGKYTSYLDGVLSMMLNFNR